MGLECAWADSFEGPFAPYESGGISWLPAGAVLKLGGAVEHFR